MAYNSKFSGARIDELLDKIEEVYEPLVAFPEVAEQVQTAADAAIKASSDAQAAVKDAATMTQVNEAISNAITTTLNTAV